MTDGPVLNGAPRMADFYSGTGRVSWVFKKEGWNAVSVDLYQAADVKADCLRTPFKAGDFDFIWASPPCESYSLANPRARAISIRGLTGTLEEIFRLHPQRWVMENVQGAARYIGWPEFRWGSRFLWSSHRLQLPQTPFRVKSIDKVRDPLRRAAIPVKLVRSIARQVKPKVPFHPSRE